MNNLHVKSGLTHIKGTVQEELGHATGNYSMMFKGFFNRFIAKAQKWMGDKKDEAKQKADDSIEKQFPEC